MQDGVQCALEVSRLQLEKWKNSEPRAQEEALAQKALLQEELVTIRARMCDVSLVCYKQEKIKQWTLRAFYRRVLDSGDVCCSGNGESVESVCANGE